ncbi:apolipoprotein N-acyltransferase [Gluconacetobacter tumulisoli]|uniref:Apolipoprotein N-acyltransferase n=2 Tax=Gluconacetobacter tumulisoli TaxID=1286189 RepID=A0A7W4K865_9PROT|nr:apolipoprotein N-acyltransferase [Gluconacetobacter tumulisoli]
MTLSTRTAGDGLVRPALSWRSAARVADCHGWRADLLMLLAGAAAALAFPPVDLLPVLALCFPLLMRAIDRAGSWRGAARRGFMFGLGLHTAGLYWLTDAILVRVDTFWWLVPLAAPGCALILAPMAAVPAGLCRLVPAGWRRWLAFAGLWTLFDMGRVFIFSGFPWNPLGSAWEISGLPGDVMIQPAAWVGVDGLTLGTVLLALLPLAGRRGVAMSLGGVLAWAALGGALLVLRPVPAGHNPVVVLVQGNVPETQKISGDDDIAIFRRYLALTQQGVAQALAGPAAAGRPVVFAWPESAFPGLLQEDDVARGMIARAGAGAAAGVIGSIRRDENDRWRNSVMAVAEPDGRLADIYDKAHLVPFGEYQPAFLPFHVVPGDGMAAGSGLRTWHLPGVAPVGPLICYEVIFSGQVVDRRDRPDWLVNVTNDGWYGNTAGPRQHLAAVRIRAVEEGMPIARAANTGISAAFDAHGHEIVRLGWNRQGVLVVSLTGTLPVTIFGLFGRWVPLALAVCTILLAAPWRAGGSRRHA